MVRSDKYSWKRRLAPYLKKPQVLGVILIALVIPFTYYMIGQQTRSRQDAALTDTFITPGTMNLTATFNSIGVELFFDGDANKNAVAKLEFKKKNETNWREGLPLWGTYSPDAPGPAFYGSALLLAAGTEYDVKVTLSDSDGVTGTQTITKSISTRAENIPAASSLNPTHFVRVDGNDANSGNANTTAGAWKTLERAFSSAPTDAIVKVNAGIYLSPKLARTLPITLIGESGAIIESGSVAERNAGLWKQETLLGPATGKSFTVWCWNGAANIPDVMAIAPDANAVPQRIAYWAKKKGDFNGYTLQTQAGWMEVLYENSGYNYGFTSFANGDGTSKVCARLNDDANPNNFRVVATDSLRAGGAIIFNTSNTRLSGFELRSTQVKFEETANNGIVDHNRMYMSTVYYNANPNTLKYPTNHLVEHNEMYDTNLWSVDPEKPAIPRLFIKNNISIPGFAANQFWNRVGENMETTAIHGRGGAHGLVVRNNRIEGWFNAVGAYAKGFDRYPKQDNDIHDNIVRFIGDDAFEPDLGVINYRVWNNRIEDSPIIISLGPSRFGPAYIFRNTIWNMGNSGVGQTNDGQTGIGAAIFKYSGNSTPQTLVYFVNNTVWTSQKPSHGAGQFAGGGGNQEAFRYYNNIVRVNGYVLQTPPLPKFVEDYNYWSTIDPTRGMNVGGDKSLTTIERYRATTGMGTHSNISGGFNVEPSLTDPTKGILTLSINSPQIDAGTVIPNIADNYDALSAYLGSAPDLGATELGGTGTPLATPTPTTGTSNPTATPTTTAPTPTTQPPIGGTAATTTLALSPATAGKSAGTTTTTNVTITTQNSVTNADLALTFNPSVIEVTAVTLGGFLPQAQEVTKNIDNIAGKVLYSFYTDNANAKSGTGTIARVTWRAKAAGTSTLAFDPSTTIVYGTGTGNTIASGGLSSATYTVTGVLATPTPTAPATQPTATNTPIPPTATTTPATPCSLSNARWSTNTAGEGESVTLTATTNNSTSCTGKQVSFEVKENDSAIEGGLDDNVSANPQNVTITGSAVSATWNAEWHNDCGGFCNPNEFYFNAQIVGQSGTTIRSAEPYLTITESSTPIYTLQVQLNKNVTASTISGVQISINSNDGTITKTITLNSTSVAGVYTGPLPLLIDPGTYTMYIKAPGYLVKKYTISITSGSTAINLTSVALVGGDVNNDNVVNTLDLGKVVEDYSPQIDTTAMSDITKDKRVNALDLGIVIENYFKQGDAL